MSLKIKMPMFSCCFFFPSPDFAGKRWDSKPYFLQLFRKKNGNGEQKVKQKKDFSITEAGRVIYFPPSCVLQTWAGEGNFICSLQGLQPGRLTKKRCEMELGKEAQIHQKVFMGQSLYA